MKKIFTLIAAALMAVNVSAANKVLKITGTADKVNPWDSQCYINLKNLEKGKAYVVKFDVYTTAGTEFKIGTEAIDETQTEHMTEWNASAVFNYTEELTLTNQKSEAVMRALKKVPNFKLHSLFLNFNSCPRSISSFKSGILFWTGI